MYDGRHLLFEVYSRVFIINNGLFILERCSNKPSNMRNETHVTSKTLVSNTSCFSGHAMLARTPKWFTNFYIYTASHAVTRARTWYSSNTYSNWAIFVDRVYRVLIGSANTQQTLSWILERVHLTSCFDLNLDLSSEFRFNRL